MGRHFTSIVAASFLALAGFAGGAGPSVFATGGADVKVYMGAPSSVQWGQNFNYGVQVVNSGPDPATGVVLTVQLPNEIAYRGSNGPGCNVAGQTVTCALGSRGMNTVSDFQIFGQAVHTGSTVTQATVTGNEPDPNPSNNSASVAIDITPSTTADLSVGIAANPNPANIGDSIHFTVFYGSEGPGNATNTTVTDELPSGFTFLPGESDPTCTVDAGNTVTCALPTIWPRSEGDLTIAARADVPGTYTNNVSIRSDQTDATPSDNSAAASIQVLPSADLAVTNSAAPNSVTPGHKLTIALTVTNNGPSAASNVNLTDSVTVVSQIKGGIAFVSVATSQGTCVQDGFGVNCNLGSLAPGSSATVTLVIQPRSKGTLSDTASATANERDPNQQNNTATTTVVVG